jgi:hypothetical protein
MRRIFRGLEVSEGEVADFAARVRFFQKTQHFLFRHSGKLVIGRFGVDALAIAKVGEDIERRGAGTRALLFR